MSKIRCQDDLQTIISQGQFSHAQVNSNLEALNARWSGLRESYQGMAADDVENHIALINQQSEALLEKLLQLSHYCDAQAQQLEGQE